MTLAGAASSIGGANLLAWYGAILPEPERRYVAPRVMGLTQGLGATLLLPVALLVQVGLPYLGLVIYALVFGTAGSRDRRAGRGPPPPPSRPRSGGRARPGPAPEPGDAPVHQGGRDRCRRPGFGPYLSIYSISVLGLPPAFAILLSAVSSAASLVAATIVGGWLHRGSSSRVLRISFILRGGSMIIGLLALPMNPLAWLVLCVVAAMASAGASAGILAANKRLLRLTGGANLIGARHGSSRRRGGTDRRPGLVGRACWRSCRSATRRSRSCSRRPG